jgi:hypothetical protein
MSTTRITNLPDDDHVMRYVPWGKLRRDEDDNVLGFLPQAFQLRPGEEGLSVNWLEYFSNPATRRQDSVWDMRKAMGVGAQSAFAIGDVGKIKATCLDRGVRVRIVYEPDDKQPAHSAIRRLPRDDLILLAALADDAFVEMVRNVEIPQQPDELSGQAIADAG